jgi:hypothetical protein
MITNTKTLWRYVVALSNVPGSTRYPLPVELIQLLDYEAEDLDGMSSDIIRVGAERAIKLNVEVLIR